MAELVMLADRHTVVTHPVSSLAKDRESSPAETSILTTLRRQLAVGAKARRTDRQTDRQTLRTAVGVKTQRSDDVLF